MTQTPKKPRKSRAKAALTLEQMEALGEMAFLAGNFFFRGMVAASQELHQQQKSAKEDQSDASGREGTV